MQHWSVVGLEKAEPTLFFLRTILLGHQPLIWPKCLYKQRTNQSRPFLAQYEKFLKQPQDGNDFKNKQIGCI